MGKIRIKERFAFSDYGIPVAPTQTIMTPKDYIEWQKSFIGRKIQGNNYQELLHKNGEDVFIFLDPPYYATTKSKFYGKIWNERLQANKSERWEGALISNFTLEDKSKILFGTTQNITYPQPTCN